MTGYRALAKALVSERVVEGAGASVSFCSGKTRGLHETMRSVAGMYG